MVTRAGVGREERLLISMGFLLGVIKALWNEIVVMVALGMY